MLSIQCKTHVSLGIPEIIFNAAQPNPDFFQEFNTELLQLSKYPHICFVWADVSILQKQTTEKIWEGSSAM